MIKERITRKDIDSFKREVLECSVLVTIDDAARILSCSTRTVRNLVSEGALIAHNRHGCSRPNRGTRILAAELKEYVKSIRVDMNE